MSSTRSTGQSNVHSHPWKSTVVYQFCCQRWTEKRRVWAVSEGLHTKKKEPQSWLVAALSIFTYDSSSIAVSDRVRTITEDDCKDNERVEDVVSRQPARKAGGHALAARPVYIGLTADFTRCTCNVSGPGKRCRARFLRLSAKHVACFCAWFQRKMLRTPRGRTSLCYVNYTLPFDHWQCGIGNKF